MKPKLVVCLLWSVLVITAHGAVHFVDVNSTNPVSPFNSWASAAQNIQDAIDVAVAGDQVLVTNGLYQSGGRISLGTLTNRVTIDKPITVQSVNGPAVTLIQGSLFPSTNAVGHEVRCAYVTNGAVLTGFTLTNGAVLQSGDNYTDIAGAGVWCESTNVLVTNCIFIGHSGDEGVAARSGRLVDCTITGNFANFGGATDDSSLNRCTISYNAGGYGCAAAGGMLKNCLVVSNTYPSGRGSGYTIANAILCNCTVVANSSGGLYYSESTNCIVYYNTYHNQYDTNQPRPAVDYPSHFTYCCYSGLDFVSPYPGNLTNEPIFVDMANGNWRVRTNSPCLNAGTNGAVSTAFDLDGNVRIFGEAVDMGAYETQALGLSKFQLWLQRYGLAVDGSVDYVDTDGDGMNNWQEWRCGTDPTDPQSVLRMLTPVSAPPYLIVSWQSVPDQTYLLERRTNPAPATPCLTFELTATHSFYSVYDYVGTNGGPYFYRVRAK